MTKQKILLFIPIVIIAGLLLYCWTVILFTDINATWRHYTAIGLFSILLFLLFKNWTKAVLSTGLYLLLGTCNLLSLTPSILTNSYGLRIRSLEMWTPTFQLLSFGIFILYCILNFDTLVTIYLDYKEAKDKNKV